MENQWVPGEPEPQQGYYLAHNVFGSPSKPRGPCGVRQGKFCQYAAEDTPGYWLEKSMNRMIQRPTRLVSLTLTPPRLQKLGLSHKRNIEPAWSI